MRFSKFPKYFNDSKKLLVAMKKNVVNKKYIKEHFNCIAKNFKVSQPIIDTSKQYKGGPFGSAGGQIPEGGQQTNPPPPNPLMTFSSENHFILGVLAYFLLFWECSENQFGQPDRQAQKPLGDKINTF